VRKTGWLAALSIALGLAACAPQSYLPAPYAAPLPPPLQPYMGPAVGFVAPAPAARIAKRHYPQRKHQRRVRCRCLPLR